MSINTEDVVQFMISKGGKVTNKDLVSHFINYFKDKRYKDENKEKFKTIINEIASVNKDSVTGNKLIVLKSEYQKVNIVQNSDISVENDCKSENFTVLNDKHKDSIDNKEMLENDKENNSPLKSIPQIMLETPTKVEIIVECSTPLSVKERTKQLNKIASEEVSPILQPVSPKSVDVVQNEHDSFSNKEKQFILAAAEGDYQELSKILSKDPSMATYRCPFNGFTALHYACKAGRIDILKLLMEHHANPNQVTYSGSTALHLAVQFKAPEDMISMLVNCYKVKPDLMDYHGWTAKDYLTEMWQKPLNSDRVLSLISEEKVVPSLTVSSIISNFNRRGSEIKLQPSNVPRSLTQELEYLLEQSKEYIKVTPHAQGGTLSGTPDTTGASHHRHKVDRRPSHIFTLNRYRSNAKDKKKELPIAPLHTAETHMTPVTSAFSREYVGPGGVRSATSNLVVPQAAPSSLAAGTNSASAAVSMRSSYRLGLSRQRMSSIAGFDRPHSLHISTDSVTSTLTTTPQPLRSSTTNVSLNSHLSSSQELYLLTRSSSTPMYLETPKVLEQLEVLSRVLLTLACED